MSEERTWLFPGRLLRTCAPVMYPGDVDATSRAAKAAPPTPVTDPSHCLFHIITSHGKVSPIHILLGTTNYFVVVV